ncbi:MAG: DUF2510 domain-containing protein [Propioniciclava sp.]
MSDTPSGWYNDGSGTMRWWDGTRWTEQTQGPPPGTGVGGLIGQIQADANAGAQPRPATAGGAYVVLQVILKEKFWGTASANLTELEQVINRQASLGYRLHTISTTSSGTTGLGGGDRIQATLVFERIT